MISWSYRLTIITTKSPCSKGPDHACHEDLNPGHVKGAYKPPPKRLWEQQFFLHVAWTPNLSWFTEISSLFVIIWNKKNILKKCMFPKLQILNFQNLVMKFVKKIGCWIRFARYVLTWYIFHWRIFHQLPHQMVA